MTTFIEIENFKETYEKLREEGKPDKEICSILFISKNTLIRFKKKHGIPLRFDADLLYFTREQMEQAKEKGVPYKDLLNRVKNLGWNVEKAIQTPVKKYRREN